MMMRAPGLESAILILGAIVMGFMVLEAMSDRLDKRWPGLSGMVGAGVIVGSFTDLGLLFLLPWLGGGLALSGLRGSALTYLLIGGPILGAILGAIWYAARGQS